jgi:hypothetical protein
MSKGEDPTMERDQQAAFAATLDRLFPRSQLEELPARDDPMLLFCQLAHRTGHIPIPHPERPFSRGASLPS